MQEGLLCVFDRVIFNGLKEYMEIVGGWVWLGFDEQVLCKSLMIVVVDFI